MSSNFASMRLQKELLGLQMDPPPGIYGVLHDDNIMIWDVTICGPDYGPWQGVFEDGTVCLDILGYNNWSPIWSAPFLLIAIQSILCDPFVDSAANFEAARLFVTDRKKYNREVSKIVELSWT